MARGRPNPRADHARAIRAKVGNAEFGARRLSRRSFVVPRAPNREFGIDSFGIESLQLEILGFGFAPALASECCVLPGVVSCD
jgi:hypothetical protein